MKVRRHLWLAAVACAACAVLLAAGQSAAAQCAMCRSAIAGAPEAAKLSARLNLGVLVLLVPPVAIFCGIFYAVFRQRKSGAQEMHEGARVKTKARLLSAFAALREKIKTLAPRRKGARGLSQ